MTEERKVFVPEIEHSFARVPLECANRLFRLEQKAATKELNAIVAEIETLTTVSAEAGDEEEQIQQEHNLKIDELLKRVDSLEQQIVDSSLQQEKFIKQCLTRIQHLCEGEKLIPAADSSANEEDEEDERVAKKPRKLGCSEQIVWTPWEQTRVDRLVARYMLRQGYVKSAEAMAAAASLDGFLDYEVYATARTVKDGLRNRDIAPALQWCSENASRLRRLESSFEFEIRLQQFIELARSNQKVDALNYAQTHLSPLMDISTNTSNTSGGQAKAKQENGASRADIIQAAMASLVYPKAEDCPLPEAQRLFSLSRWDFLIEQFETENNRVYGISPVDELVIALQCGLMLLKTPLCHYSDDEEEEEAGPSERVNGAEEVEMKVDHAPETGARKSKKEKKKGGENYRNPKCPVCTKHGNELAKDLPFAHHSHSCLVCRVTGEIMDENNPPMVLPNGYAYSRKALEEMAKQNNGTVTCIRTGNSYPFSKAKNVYII